jgi:hypothetical protein
VGTGLSDDNKLIGLVTEYDFYRPGERVVLRFIRMTGFPIGVLPDFILERIDHGAGSQAVGNGRPDFNIPINGPCPQFASVGDMMDIQYRLPEALSSGRYCLRASFCRKKWEAMPSEVATPPFEIVNPCVLNER